MKPEMTAAIKWVAHGCCQRFRKYMPSCLMFRIVKMVWVYLWMSETRVERPILLSFEKLMPEPQYGGFGGNKRVKLLSVCISSVYGPNEVKLHTTFNPIWEKYVRPLLHHCVLFLTELCLCLQGNKRLCNGCSGQGVWGVENQPPS